jgi:hypothetical protein
LEYLDEVFFSVVGRPTFQYRIEWTGCHKEYFIHRDVVSILRVLEVFRYLWRNTNLGMVEESDPRLPELSLGKHIDVLWFHIQSI